MGPKVQADPRLRRPGQATAIGQLKDVGAMLHGEAARS